ncbi:hypothetical protein PGTUg99_030082 [Puccinia graminis f. sp. tritici]|uniref:Uncharacterized protein n=1 Tax=Puccinia graminis f. sp. tritici TaxID=56615 RepID=A0A5B0PPL7_PUCGR|nr:hypothetical protein PGTUg99_030082 [Puccinia graminis f. sp. tritici]
MDNSRDIREEDRARLADGEVQEVTIHDGAHDHRSTDNETRRLIILPMEAPRDGPLSGNRSSAHHTHPTSFVRPSNTTVDPGHLITPSPVDPSLLPNVSQTGHLHSRNLSANRFSTNPIAHPSSNSTKPTNNHHQQQQQPSLTLNQPILNLDPESNQQQQQPNHQTRPQNDSHQRPSKRPRYAIGMQSNHQNQNNNNNTNNLTSSSSSSIQPPLYSDDEDDEMSEARPANSSIINNINNNHSSTSRPQHSKSPNNPTIHPPQDLQSLLKNFSDGLRALAPHLISSSPPAPDGHQSLNPDSQVDQPNQSHPLPHPLHPPWPMISDIDREEIVRLLLQSLKEIGYPAAAMTLEVESGFSLDPSPEITSFRQNVLNGKWLEVDELLQKEYLKYCDHSQISSSPLSPVYNKHDSCDNRIAKSLFGVDVHVLKLARFLVIQEKYLELLESRQIRKALVVLRSEIAPLVTPPGQNGSTPNLKSKSSISGIGLSFNGKLSSPTGNGALTGWTNNQDDDPGVQRLCLLSSLMMCGTSDEVRERAEWDGVANGSRVKLLEELQELIPPQKLLPHQRLPRLLEQSKTLQRLQCLYHVTNPKISLLSNHTCSRSAFPTETSHVLSRHTDEVWRIEWAHDGRRLASADRAKTCIIWKVKSNPAASSSSASNPVGSNRDSPRMPRSSRFSGPSSPDKKPSSRRTQLGSQDEELEFEVDLVLDRHPAGIACIAWSPDDSVLLTGSDSTITMWNTRTGDCIATMVKHAYDVGALSWLPDGRSFVSGGLDTNVLFWDLKGQNTYKWQVGPTRINDLAVSPDGKRLVVIGTAAVDPSDDHHSASAQESANPAHSVDDSPARLHHQSQSALLDNHRSSHATATPTAAAAASGDSGKQGRIHIFNIPEKRQIAMIPLSPDLTCVSISDDSKYALINQSPNQVLLYSLEEQKLIRRYVGQKQGRFIIRSCFGGLDRNFVLSGSEDGKIYVWHMETGALIEVLAGHGEGTVNAVAWNSVDPPLFASASDDHTVRIWQAPNDKRSSTTPAIDHHHPSSSSKETSNGDGILPNTNNHQNILELLNHHHHPHSPPPPPPPPDPVDLAHIRQHPDPDDLDDHDHLEQPLLIESLDHDLDDQHETIY